MLFGEVKPRKSPKMTGVSYSFKCLEKLLRGLKMTLSKCCLLSNKLVMNN